MGWGDIIIKRAFATVVVMQANQLRFICPSQVAGSAREPWGHGEDSLLGAL